MGKNDIDFEAQSTELVEQYKVEAANMMIDAFNQGYLLGQQYAKKQFNKE
jgi:hypothetical protein